MTIWKKLTQIFVIVTVMIIIPKEMEATSFTSNNIDATHYDFVNEGPLPLTGDWELYWDELLEPDDFHETPLREPTEYISLPTELRSMEINEEKIDEDGYGTLRLNVKIDDVSQVYSLKSNYLASAYRVWVNGELLVSTGEVAKTKEEYTPAYLPMQSAFKVNDNEIEIIIQIANFHHRRIRLGTIYLGTTNEIHLITNKGLIKDSILFGSLFLIAIYHFILYFFRKKEKAFIYFSCISLIVCLRVGIVNERMLVRFFPEINAELMMKIGYFPVFLLLPLFILYVKELFRTKELARLSKIASSSIFIFIVLISVTTIKFYDALFQYGQWLLFGFALYTIYLLYKKVFLQKASGSYAMILGIFIVFLTAIHDTLREYDVIQSTELLTTGVFIFVLSQAFYLAWRYDDSFNQVLRLAKENEVINKEIKLLNDSLDEKIALRTNELQAANQKLSQLSNHDPLTGLPNRRYFDQILQQTWEQSIQNQKPLSLLLLDIDFFKNYNDYYGHLEGDECLKKVADQLKKELRKEDFICRFGGEEFVVLLPNTNADIAFSIAEKMRLSIESLELRHEFSDVSNVVTVSIGIRTIIATNNLTISDFINHADQALYIVKNTERNSSYCF